MGGARAELLGALTLAPPDPAQRAQVEALGSLGGQKLEPLGRAVVLAMSASLGASEYVCWRHLLAASAAGELDAAPGEPLQEGLLVADATAERAAASLLRERQCTLLLLLDCVKLACTAPGARSPAAQAAAACAARFVTALCDEGLGAKLQAAVEALEVRRMLVCACA